jgi:uncharacterized membrane protein YbhN (UPF0104 family)
MTSESIDYMTRTGMLYLDKQRRKNHFDAALTLRYVAIIPVGITIYFLFKNGFSSWLTSLVFSIVGAGIFLLASIIVYKKQQRKLKLTDFKTGLPKNDNYSIAKKAVENLQWTIKADSIDFIEAYNPHRDFRTWGNEMISILLLDNDILLNSICNLDLMNQAAFSFGKNKKNVDKFINEFKHLNSK